MANHKTPVVHVQEIRGFPTPVTDGETALPAFIGYTERAEGTNGEDLHLTPVRIASLAEFERCFGGPRAEPILVTIAPEGASGYAVSALSVAGRAVAPADAATPLPTAYFLYHGVRMYFDNGGAACYVVSVGGYADGARPEKAALLQGLARLEARKEPTLIVVPEAVALASGYTDVVRAVLAQCGTVANRFGIFDLLHGADPGRLAEDRDAFGTAHLEHGAAYFPFVRTSLPHPVRVDPVTGTSNVRVRIAGEGRDFDLSSLSTPSPGGGDPGAVVREALTRQGVVLPPSAAVAGVFAATDARRGVWKAPAGIAVADVVAPLVRVDDSAVAAFADDPVAGKSVNVLRQFPGKGTLVWGARTLAGHDNEWRYVPVRRFLDMVEESLRKATEWAVFEPNEDGTWIKLRGTIQNYLTRKWREGALLGRTPDEAFFVECGLGTTMTAQDVLEGRLNVQIGMAVVRPAEFIILKLSHKVRSA